ncbi:citramalate synthase [Rhodohalobacter sulfatireducens]|uniref:Citramalate synthase n=1 Tax=Rhodohalobacter sulfatireducens TaxID=2911366 RepID=A0ABS9KCR2_9BACT|nr:citramalate synthase [Rhodohalobacter sulfatireducens]MCG2588649.1 citramalate synthase [Rhodohalobacter sulfatireducens]
MSKSIQIFDTTLRDGTQGEKVSFSAEDKLRIAKRLDEFGIDYIEGGWPGSNPKDMAFFDKAKNHNFSHSKIVAFGSTCRAGNQPEEDPNLKALIAAETPAVSLFGKSWLLHVHEALKITPEENLELISGSIEFLKKNGKEVIYDAEHFFDGYKDNREYALKTLRAAELSGADVIVLCDTNGGTLTHEITKIVEDVSNSIDAAIGIHSHNDCELGVANAVAAIEAGAVHVQGTINGYGERCGNANLCSVIPNLQLKLGYSCIPEEQMKHLSTLSKYVSELANLIPDNKQPYVGRSAFAHKGGVHVSAVMKNEQTYEHVKPELIGNSRRVLLSELSGKSNISYKSDELGFDFDKTSKEGAEIIKELKKLENEGYQFEAAEASFELLVKQKTSKKPDFFHLEGFRVIMERNAKGESRAEATIKVRVNDQVELCAAEGNGPVNALDAALRKALCEFYPEISTVTLQDYKVRVLNGDDGTGAKVRVLIDSAQDGSSWGTVGVSENIIDASWKALSEGIIYFLMNKKSKPKHKTTIEFPLERSTA